MTDNPMPKTPRRTPAPADFCRTALEELKALAEGHAKQHACLHHMLVLPEGEGLFVPAPPGVHPLGSSSCHVPPAVSFGDSHVAATLLPTSCWPPDLEPLRAVVAEQEFAPYRPLAQRPYRVHLFFGDAGAMATLEDLAGSLMDLAGDVGRAVFGAAGRLGEGMDTVFFDSPDCIHAKDAAVLDAWLCTVHWWAWKAIDSPIYTRPRVVFGGSAIEADRRDKAVGEKLSFSALGCDVFTATAATIHLFLRFLSVPPDLIWAADYPPKPEPETPGLAQASTEPKEASPDAPAAEETAQWAALPERVKTAFMQYKEAERVLLEQGAIKPTDRKCYERLKAHNDGDRVPAFNTWQRYVRKARQGLDQQKNTPRAGRPYGRSIVSARDIEPLETDN